MLARSLRAARGCVAKAPSPPVRPPAKLVSTEARHSDRHAQISPTTAGTRSRRRLLASPMLPLEAVAVTGGVQGAIQRAVKEAKLSLPEFRQGVRPSEHSVPPTSRRHETGDARPVERTGSRGMRDVRAPSVLPKEKRELATAITAAPLSLAANVYVMSELRRCRPGIQPRSILDFGAGTAVSVSAAARVFRDFSTRADISNPDGRISVNHTADFSASDQAEFSAHPESIDPRVGERRGRAQADWTPSGCTSLETVAIIDQAPAMRRLGNEILRNDEFVRSSRKLVIKAVGSVRDARPPILSDGFDIVSASYALSEVAQSNVASHSLSDPGLSVLDSAQLRERRLKSAILSLWKAVKPGGYLVIIEDGTLPGFETVLFARELLLNRHYRTTRPRSGGKMDEPGNTRDVSITRAEVVAPCLHSKSCPLEGKASRSRVCRFVQRLNRPPYLRTAIPRPDGFEDQYFSYAVIEKRSAKTICDDQVLQVPDVHTHDGEAVTGEGENPKGWGRLIRTPWRKEKHIILDACTADATLERRVVSRGNAPDGMYMTARKARWGDVWPVAPPNAPQDAKFG